MRFSTYPPFQPQFEYNPKNVVNIDPFADAGQANLLSSIPNDLKAAS